MRLTMILAMEGALGRFSLMSGIIFHHLEMQKSSHAKVFEKGDAT